MAISQNNNQIQPKWPLQIDRLTGPYASVESVADSIKQDFIFLLQTIPGEWPMNPDLGIGLITYLFENFESLEVSDIQSNIEKQLKKYLPNLRLVNIEFISSPENRDRYMTTLRISYAILDLGASGDIDFGLNEVTKTFVNMESINSKVGSLL